MLRAASSLLSTPGWPQNSPPIRLSNSCNASGLIFLVEGSTSLLLVAALVVLFFQCSVPVNLQQRERHLLREDVPAPHREHQDSDSQPHEELARLRMGHNFGNRLNS